MQKKVGKKAEPTAEELEFIYARLARLSDSEILDEMQEADFALRTKGFIKRRRREFDAAKRVLQLQLQKELDPVVARKKEEHFNHMAEIANSLLTATWRDLEDIRKNPRWHQTMDPSGEYVGGTQDAPWGFHRQWLADYLKENLDVASSRKWFSAEEREEENALHGITVLECDVKEYPQYDLDCLMTHLQTESPEVESKGIDRAVKENPYEVLETLRLISRRKTFKGKCPVCQDW